MYRFLIALFITVVFIGCNESAKETDSSSGSDTISLTIQQIKENEIEIGKIEKRMISDIVKANGMVDVPPQYRASVSTMMGGYVESTEVLEGDVVAKGEILAVLKHQEFIKLQQQYVEALSRTSFLEKELERQKQLREENINSRKEFERVESELKIGIAQVNALKANLQMIGIDPEKVERGEITSRISIRSPLKGGVIKVNTSLGQFVRPEEVLFEIVSKEHLHIDLKVYEKDVTKIKEGQKVLVKFSQNDIVLASIVLVGKSLDPHTRTVSVHAHLDKERKDIIPGMYVNAEIQLENREVVTLPEEAIVKEGEKSYIFIQTSADNQKINFEKRLVETGAIQDGNVEVNLPFDFSPNIVRKGAYFLFANTMRGEED